VRKNILYADRVKGDLELGLEPSRLGGDGEKAWARADFPGKRMPGMADQHIYESSVTQKFEIGTKREEYGRTFRYGQAGEALTLAGHARLVGNGNFVPDATSYPDVDGFYGKPYAQVEVDDLYIDLDIATAYPANYFQGGYIIAFTAAVDYSLHYIVKSDLGNGTYCRIYLDHPWTSGVVAVTIDVEVSRSPYSSICDCHSINWFKSFVGLGQCAAVLNEYYFWLQTKGPCWLTPYNWTTGVPGYTTRVREVYAWSDGEITVDPNDGTLQRIGYLLSATEAGFGSVFIMLQLE